MRIVRAGRNAGRLALLLPVLTAGAPPAAAQTALPSSEAILALRSELGELKARSPANADLVLVNKATDAVDQIEGQWLATGATLPVEYRLSLSATLEALRSIPADASVAAYRPVLLNVSRDLELKADYAAGGLAAEPTFKGAVEVTVQTLRGATEEHGYLVRCNPRLLGLRQPALFLFSSASSPTARSLPPGNYSLWLERQDGTVVTRQEIEVGSTGAAKQTIRVMLP